MVSNDKARSLEELLANGWDYHDKESERLARELEAAADQGVAAHNLAPFLHLSSHDRRAYGRLEARLRIG
jgi:hypothetical protein